MSHSPSRLLLPLLLAASASARQSPFGPALLNMPTTDPIGLVAGDMDGDGRLDLVVRTSNGSLWFYRAAGAATYLLPTVMPSPMGSNAYVDLALADLDRDGDLDVFALRNFGAQSVLVLYSNLGAGTFAAPTSIPLAFGSTGFLVADLDGDAWIDVVIADGTSGGAIRLLRNDGTGALIAPVPVTSAPGVTLRRIEGSDLDNDGDVDLAMITNGSTLAVARNQGGASFGPLESFAIPAPVDWCVLGDWNGDGWCDLAIAGTNVPVRVLTNDGTGAFGGTSAVAAVFGVTTDLDAGDFDRDGRLDLVWQTNSRRTWIARGLGTGVFEIPSSTDTGGFHEFAIADLDDDGFLDAAVAVWGQRVVNVRPGDGRGGFREQSYAMGAFVGAIELADWNSDGRTDVTSSSNTFDQVFTRLALPGGGFGPQIASACPWPGQMSAAFVDVGPTLDLVVTTGYQDVGVMYGDGAGGFSALAPAVSVPEWRTMVAGDVTGDGFADIVVGASPGSGRSVVLRGTGTGGFLPILTTNAESKFLTLADWNGDGVKDIARQETAALQVWFSDGNGGFTNTVVDAANLYALAATDLDLDGRADLLASHFDDGLLFYRGDGAGGFAPRVVLSFFAGSSLQTRDIDGDGDIDIVSVLGSSSIRTLEQTAPGNFVEVGHVYGNGNYYGPIGLADVSEDGRPDLIVASNVPASVGSCTIVVRDNVGRPGTVVTYCTAQTSSNGCTPRIDVTGTPSATRTSGFTISSLDTPNGRRGMLLYSLNGRAALPFHGGTFCLRAPVFRSPLRSSGGDAGPTNCSGAFEIDFNAFAHGLGGGTPQPSTSIVGRQVTAQWWSRDPGSLPGHTNLSNAVDFAVGP